MLDIEAGDGRAAYQLSGVYACGIVPADPNMREKWLKIAVALGYEPAKIELERAPFHISRREAHKRLAEINRDSHDKTIKEMNRKIMAPVVNCSNLICKNKERKGIPLSS